MSTPRPVQITDSQLTLEHLPPPDADWSAIFRFALAFDGWEYFAQGQHSTGLAAFANSVLRAFRQEGAIPPALTLSELRACLFYEDRRRRHLDRSYVEAEWMPYVHALLESIRDRLRTAKAEANAR